MTAAESAPTATPAPAARSHSFARSPISLRLLLPKTLGTFRRFEAVGAARYDLSDDCRCRDRRRATSWWWADGLTGLVLGLIEYGLSARPMGYVTTVYIRLEPKIWMPQARGSLRLGSLLLL